MEQAGRNGRVGSPGSRLHLVANNDISRLTPRGWKGIKPIAPHLCNPQAPRCRCGLMGTNDGPAELNLQWTQMTSPCDLGLPLVTLNLPTVALPCWRSGQGEKRPYN